MMALLATAVVFKIIEVTTDWDGMICVAGCT